MSYLINPFPSILGSDSLIIDDEQIEIIETYDFNECEPIGEVEIGIGDILVDESNDNDNYSDIETDEPRSNPPFHIDLDSSWNGSSSSTSSEDYFDGSDDDLDDDEQEETGIPVDPLELEPKPVVPIPKPQQEKRHIYRRKAKEKELDYEDEEEIILCTDCNIRFEDKVKLRQHRRIHRVKERKCPHCGKSFNRQFNLDVHLRSHTGEKKFTCDNCNKSYAKKQSLNTHMKAGKCKRKPFKCTVCTRSYELVEQLNAHKKSHLASIKSEAHNYSGPKDHPPKILIQKTRLKSAKYKCDECELDYTNRVNLKSHLRSHHGGGPFPFECPECGRRFPLKTRLNFHLRVHTGEKPHQCQECKKRFRLKAHLIVHERTHSGEMPFKCYQCHKKFSQRIHLSTHMLTHTGETPFPCKHCEKAYPRAAALKRHVQKCHPDVNDSS